MDFEKRLKEELEKSVELIKGSRFFEAFSKSENVKDLYCKYLQCAYHFVVNTSSFTPLAARRMEAKHLRLRKWILEHSAEEMGHELMALKDLERLGFSKNDILNAGPSIGVKVWTSFFHYKVTMDNPFAAFGVLYFLEGLAQTLAPVLLPGIMESLSDDEKKAITFLREHGELDADHLKEQEELLLKSDLSDENKEVILRVIGEAAHVKMYMLDNLIA